MVIIKKCVQEKSYYQVHELTTRWSKLFDETITDSYILQWAIDEKFSLYIANNGLRQVNLIAKAGLINGPARKIVAYLESEYIQLVDFQIRTLLSNEPLTISILNLSRSNFIQGDEPFDLSQIKGAVIKESERFVITPDGIKYLYVALKDVMKFEREHGCLSDPSREDETNNVPLTLIEDSKPLKRINPAKDDPDKSISALFDPVPVEALEKMFPADGKWKRWAEKAKSNGLICSRLGRAMFNPYIAGRWFMTKGQDGWDDARINRVLANNLPARSRDEKYQLTGEIN